MFDKHKSAKQSTPVAAEPRVSPAAPSMTAGTSVSKEKFALIGQGISIKGDVKADCSVRVEGRIEGRSIQCTDEVVIAESGQVTANIIAKTVNISGLVSGDVGGSEKVMIARTGRVQGNIIAPRVQLEDGALFRGSIDMNPAKPAGAEKAATTAPAASKPASTDSSQKVLASTPTKSPASAADSARKEPSLNLKSG